MQTGCMNGWCKPSTPTEELEHGSPDWSPARKRAGALDDCLSTISMEGLPGGEEPTMGEARTGISWVALALRVTSPPEDVAAEPKPSSMAAQGIKPVIASPTVARGQDLGYVVSDAEDLRASAPGEIAGSGLSSRQGVGSHFKSMKGTAAF